MKTLLVAILVCLGVGCVQGQAPSINTANFYLAQPEKWLDKEISVNVAWLELSDSTALNNGYKELQAETFAAARFGGYLTVLATPDAAAHIVQICGTQRALNSRGVTPHMIHGVFSKDGDHYILRVDK